MCKIRERKCEVCGGNMGYMSDAAFLEIGSTCDICLEKEE